MYMYIYINMRQTLKGLCFGPSVITLVLPLVSVSIVLRVGLLMFQLRIFTNRGSKWQ